MKYLITSLLFACSGCCAYAQNPAAAGKISAKIIDSASKAPIDYATVNLYHQGLKTTAGMASADPKGNFLISNLPFGEYSISIGYMGYRPYTADHILITKQKPSVSLNNILLVSAEKVLKAVNITGKVPVVQNKIDKLVYDLSNDLSAQGGTAIDVLKKVPSLTVDINGNVELLGSPGVNFLINGKPSSSFGANLAEALQSIPASQIKNIEVISNPGARYDAQGTAGVINIILKDNTVRGVNGSLNLAAGNRLSNGSFNLNARQRNYGISAFFSGNSQRNTTSLNSKKLTNADGADLLNQNGFSRIRRNGYQTGINFDWNLSADENITASVGYNRFGNHSADAVNQLQTTFDNTGLPLYSSSERAANNEITAHSLQWSAGYKKKFKNKNQELDVLYQSNAGTNSSSYTQLQQNLNPQQGTSGTSSYSPGIWRETGIEANYTQPVTKNFNLETGAKAFLSTISSTIDAKKFDVASQSYLPDLSQSYNFKYNRNVFAYYLSGSFKVADFLSVKAGARYEYTVNHTDFSGTVIPDYRTFNPSLVISHQIDESQSVKISYSRRIERPDYEELNPFVNRSDPYNISSGNPGLKPELGNNFEAGYSKSFKDGAALNITGFYRRNSDDIKSYTDFYTAYQQDGVTYDNVTFSRKINAGSENRIGSNIYISIPVAGKFNIRSNLLISHRGIIFDYNSLNQNSGGMEYRVNLNLSYQFPNDLSAEVFGNYNSPRVGVQGKGASFLFYNIALRKQFLNRKVSIGISATDPFNKYISQQNIITQQGNRQYALRQVPYRSFGITLSYKFGNLKFDKKDDAKAESDIPPVL